MVSLCKDKQKKTKYKIIAGKINQFASTFRIIGNLNNKGQLRLPLCVGK